MNTKLGERMIDFDEKLITKYDRNGPRYTSYPTADRFSTNFNASDYRRIFERRESGSGPFSLYFHLPFCSKLCLYCGCNKIVTKDQQQAAQYVDYLRKEIVLQSTLAGTGAKVEQLHWGGGTPTFLNAEQMMTLMGITQDHFEFALNGEYSIEIDPRVADEHTIKHLRFLGFNRLSLGVQDFDPDVQRAVNRVQSVAQTQCIVEAGRAEGFQSISFDLIYGLPKQTVDSFACTLDQVVELDPDRISVYSYAHLPDLFMPQQRINAAELPSPSAKLAILRLAIERLTQAGYVYIGMDHFAKADDELAIAQTQGKLHRNFQGYSTHADCDLIAMGVTAIGHVGLSYSQNVRTLADYYARLDAEQLPIMRGIELTHDDAMRREIIQQLMCDFALNFSRVESNFGVDFESYFAAELDALITFEEDGLIEWQEHGLAVTPRGRLLIRNVCMLFDAYLNQNNTRQRYSKVI